ncbi:hypothetical protein LSH36_455g04022 [Paralvinella palmiformis]|uniref:Uncharacterized protein n=1 Tax=Paralvinella palmiformis TaxID=53620 RepID=A0AAD9MXQ9_9ANNE|nr:hypothetical protein LSH36_455g04022 [Paralvinella palmiformis]
MGLAYIALGAQQGHPLLTDIEIDKGLVAPVVAQKLMGSSGEILILVMILMAVTSTGSSEIMAVTSRKQVKRVLKPAYKCKTHGDYRKYNDYLLSLKNWCMTFVALSVIPLTMLLDAMKVCQNERQITRMNK